MQIFDIPDEAAMLKLGGGWARILRGAVVFLGGDLGVGKTTLARGILRAMGHRGAVASPTYTLIQSYDLPRLTVYHLDLYRLNSPNELEMIGLRDLLDDSPTLLVEWPERAAGCLPTADYDVRIYASQNASRRVEVHAAATELPEPNA